MEDNVSINKLENRMRPNAYSAEGFLGLTESLEEVLLQDEVTLQKLGVDYKEISAELEKIVGEALQQKNELLRTNPKEYRERKNYSINWRKQPAPIFSLDNLPSPEIGYRIENKYQVFIIQYRGLQECPWNCKNADWGSFDFLLLNLQTGEYITAPGLIAHLIREHHFFEGQETSYRVEPLKLAQVLGLVS